MQEPIWRRVQVAQGLVMYSWDSWAQWFCLLHSPCIDSGRLVHNGVCFYFYFLSFNLNKFKAWFFPISVAMTNCKCGSFHLIFVHVAGCPAACCRNYYRSGGIITFLLVLHGSHRSRSGASTSPDCCNYPSLRHCSSGTSYCHLTWRSVACYILLFLW